MINKEVKVTVVMCDADLCNYLERLQAEVDARQGLLAYMKSRDTISAEIIESYHDEYVAYFVEYEKAKQRLQDTYVKSETARWSLNFSTKEITIYD